MMKKIGNILLSIGLWILVITFIGMFLTLAIILNVLAYRDNFWTGLFFSSFIFGGIVVLIGWFLSDY